VRLFCHLKFIGADLDKRFAQLAIELSAMDNSLKNNQLLIYGAVSMGDRWQFRVLDLLKIS
jgi:hypothetical protein